MILVGHGNFKIPASWEEMVRSRITFICQFLMDKLNCTISNYDGKDERIEKA